MGKNPALVFSEGISHCHIIRPLVLAQWLRQLSLPVIVACPSRCRDIFINEGFEVVEIPIGNVERMYRDLAKGRRMHTPQEIFVEYDKKIIDQVKPSLIASDFRLSALGLARKLSIPSVSITSVSCHPNFNRLSSLPDCFAPKGLKGSLVRNILFPTPILNSFLESIILQYHSQPIHKAFRKSSLEVLGDFYQYVCDADLCLLSDHPKVMPLSQLREQDMYCGPIRWRRDDTFKSSLIERGDSQALVYVSVGTQESLGTAFLERYIEALAQREVKVIVSKGGRNWQPRVSHKNINFVDFINEDKLLPHVDLFVFHGGTMSMYQAMFCATPMLALPANSDQHYHADAIRRLGLGNYFLPSHVELEQFLRATWEILDDDLVKIRSIEMQKTVTDFRAKDKVIKTIADLLNINSATQLVV